MKIVQTRSRTEHYTVEMEIDEALVQFLNSRSRIELDAEKGVVPIVDEQMVVSALEGYNASLDDCIVFTKYGGYFSVRDWIAALIEDRLESGEVEETDHWYPDGDTFACESVHVEE